MTDTIAQKKTNAGTSVTKAVSFTVVGKWSLRRHVTPRGRKQFGNQRKPSLH